MIPDILNGELLGEKVSCSFPTVGQFLEIENKKAIFSAGNYNALINTQTDQANFSLDVIDCLAYFSVLFPKLIQKGLIGEKMSIENSKKMVDFYRKTFWPWYRVILDIIKQEEEELKDDISKTSEK
jgi:hypothetical protein